MLAKFLRLNAEVSFWNFLILMLSSLRWMKYNNKSLANGIFQTLGWASLGLLLGLALGYHVGL